VTAPLAGTLTALTEVPDPVFAGQLVGAGVAVEPPAGARVIDVVAPAAGTLAKLHPHAFVLLTEDGTGILVHLGIDTVKLKGAGFTLHAVEGDRVAAGTLVVTFDPAAVRARGCPRAARWWCWTRRRTACPRPPPAPTCSPGTCSSPGRPRPERRHRPAPGRARGRGRGSVGD